MQVVGPWAFTIFFLFVLPITIAISPGIISFFRIKNRSVQNLRRAKRVILLSLLFLVGSYGFLVYEMFYGADETGTPGFVLAISGYMIILLPMVVTIPLADRAYELSEF